MRFKSKRELITAIEEQRAALLADLREIDRNEFETPGVWGDDWNIKDLLAHLVEWQKMLLRWYREGAQGKDPATPAPGYNWRQTPDLNRAIHEKHRERTLTAVRRDFTSTYRKVLETVREIPEKDLLTPGRFRWTGKSPLITYVAANTSSHDHTARKILKRWKRQR